MTFEKGKTIKELNIDTSRRFEVVKGRLDGYVNAFEIGDILEFCDNGDDNRPTFRRISDGLTQYTFLHRLKYAAPPWDNLSAGDILIDGDGDERNGPILFPLNQTSQQRPGP